MLFSCDNEFRWARDALTSTSHNLLTPYEVTNRNAYRSSVLVAMGTTHRASGTRLLAVLAEHMGARGLLGLARHLPRGVPVVHCGGAASTHVPLGSVVGVTQARDMSACGAFFGGPPEDEDDGAGRFSCDPSLRPDLYAHYDRPTLQAASTGSVLIKSAAARDRILVQVGTPACIDMEAAAFYTEFTDVRAAVVRGIWNRADGNKDADEARWRDGAIRGAGVYALALALALVDATRSAAVVQRDDIVAALASCEREARQTASSKAAAAPTAAAEAALDPGPVPADTLETLRARLAAVKAEFAAYRAHIEAAPGAKRSRRT